MLIQLTGWLFIVLDNWMVIVFGLYGAKEANVLKCSWDEKKTFDFITALQSYTTSVNFYLWNDFLGLMFVHVKHLWKLVDNVSVHEKCVNLLTFYWRSFILRTILHEKKIFFFLNREKCCRPSVAFDIRKILFWHKVFLCEASHMSIQEMFASGFIWKWKL